MTLRAEVVRERLRKLREVLRNLDSLRPLKREEFAATFRHHWLAERGLQLAAEAVFDIGSHVLVGSFNVHPQNYEDVLTKLAQQEVLSKDLYSELRGLGGFRNILVHEYLEIDLDRVYEILQHQLGALGRFADGIEAFLDRESIG